MKTLKFESIQFDLIEPKKHTRSGEAFLILHGLPGQFSTNLDLGFCLTSERELPCFFPYARGLGRSNGSPSLIDHVETLVKYTDFLKDEYSIEKCHLIGHSWGGFMAVNLWLRKPEFFNQVLLMAPLLKMPPNDAVKERIVTLAKQMNKIEGYDVDAEKLMADAVFMEEQMLPISKVERLKELSFNPRIIHGDNDVIIPVEHSQEFVNLYGDNAELVVLKDNHYLVERQPLKDELLKYFK